MQKKTDKIALPQEDITLNFDRSTVNMLTAREGASLRPSLIVVQGIDRGSSLIIDRSPMLIGRGEECDFIISDDGISRIHGRVILDAQNRCTIEDMNSTNGIWVGQQRVDRHVFSEGDKVVLGRSTILRFMRVDTFDEHYQSQMYESAVKDGLTGVFNRRYFDDILRSELSFAVRHRTHLSAILFDLDHFKKVNDTWGHLVGDDVLCKVARAVARTLRGEDLAARYGGEEFAVLARNIAPEGAVALAERLRQIVQDLRILTEEGIRVPVTISLGAATLCGAEVMNGDALLRTADENLYEAKRNGRNRVVASVVK